MFEVMKRSNPFHFLIKGHVQTRTSYGTACMDSLKQASLFSSWFHCKNGRVSRQTAHCTDAPSGETAGSSVTSKGRMKKSYLSGAVVSSAGVTVVMDKSSSL